MSSLHWASLTRPGIRNLTQETREKKWWKEISLIKEDWLREHLGKITIHKCMDRDMMHPQVLKELVDITARPLTILFESP